MHQWLRWGGVLRVCRALWERQMPGAVIDMQHDQGWVSAMLSQRSRSSGRGWWKGVLVEEKHPQGGEESRLPSSILRAHVCSQRQCAGPPCRAGFCRRWLFWKDSFPLPWETTGRKVSQCGEEGQRDCTRLWRKGRATSSFTNTPDLLNTVTLERLGLPEGALCSDKWHEPPSHEFPIN